MNARQQQQYASVMNCAAILDDKDFSRPEIAGLRARFFASVAHLRELSQTQSAAHMMRGTDGGALTRMRKDVRKRLMRIGRHAIAVLDGLPGIRDDVRLPHANAKDAELLKAAARITKNLRPHIRTLHETGLPKDAFPKLAATVKALKEKSGSADTAIARRSRATASIPDAIRRARTIAGALDSTIRAELPPTVAFRWTEVYRIPRKMGRPRKRPPKPGMSI